MCKESEQLDKRVMTAYTMNLPGSMFIKLPTRRAGEIGFVATRLVSHGYSSDIAATQS